MWALAENRIGLRFEYEFHDRYGQWFHAYGNEMWGFAENELMRQRFAGINDLPTKEAEWKLRWERS